MIPIDDAFSITRDGVIISVEVSAGSKHNQFPAGYNPWRKTILCRVSAPPVEGKANTAVLELIADALEIPVKAIQIHAGATSPMKKILIPGIEKQDLVSHLSSMMP